MSATPRIICFSTAVEAERSVPEAQRVLSGEPQFTVWNHFAEGTEQFFAGVWAATCGRWVVRYTEHEFCHLLAGRVVLTSEEGERMEFGPGASFVIPAGFVGTWEVIEECRKLYAIFEPR
jgi:uncharacterized protein